MDDEYPTINPAVTQIYISIRKQTHPKARVYTTMEALTSLFFGLTPSWYWTSRDGTQQCFRRVAHGDVNACWLVKLSEAVDWEIEK